MIPERRLLRAVLRRGQEVCRKFQFRARIELRVLYQRFSGVKRSLVRRVGQDDDR